MHHLGDERQTLSPVGPPDAHHLLERIRRRGDYHRSVVNLGDHLVMGVRDDRHPRCAVFELDQRLAQDASGDRLRYVLAVVHDKRAVYPHHDEAATRAGVHDVENRFWKSGLSSSLSVGQP